jgi:hypothetical protein
LGLFDNQPRRARGARPLTATLLHPLALALLAGVVLRVLLWGNLPRVGLISDEGEYLSAASWLVHGRGFAWYLGYLWTRAPVYPLLVAAHMRTFGESLEPIYVTQTLLSLLNVVMVYALARRMLGPRSAAPGLAALLTAVYFPFAVYTQVLLSETLFIALLLGTFVALARGDHGPRTEDQGPGTAPRQTTEQNAGPRRWRVVVSLWPVALAGVLLGLATLTRSLALGFAPLVVLWLLLGSPARGERRGWRADLRRRVAGGLLPSLCFAAVFGATLLPWTAYNSRLYGGPVLVDTSGAFNLLLGARTAYDGRREDAQVRDFVLGVLGQSPVSDPAASSCVPFPGTLPTQAARQTAMTREALCLIGERPLAFAQKSLAELVDLFQINYTGAERFAGGFTTGRLPRWYVLGLFLLDDTLYVLALPLAVLGWALARATDDGRRMTSDELRVTSDGRGANRAAGGARLSLVLGHSSLVVLVGLWWLYNLGAAPLLFAINRFRLPLMPFVFIFAAYALVEGVRALRRRRARGACPHPPDLSPVVGRGGEASSFGPPIDSPAGRPWSRATRAWYGLAGTLAALLWLVAATPHAYLEPRAPGTDSRWASYLGPYPSSLAITGIALDARLRGEGDARFAARLRAGDTAAAAESLRGAPVSLETARLGPALVAAHEGRPADVLAALPPPAEVDATKDARAAVLRGDALRSLGDEDGARAVFTQRYVDEANPVGWAWEWLRPRPAVVIDLGGNLDLGYIEGCYLGEGDRAERTTSRWCTDGAQLRFPGAGTGSPQRLVLLADGRGWPSDMLPVPPVRVLLDGYEVGSFTPGAAGPRSFEVPLPASPGGSDVVVTLRGATFIPGPERYLRQQSEQSVGQVQRLAVRLDRAELR